MTTVPWLILTYPTCDTCRKAKKWLKDNGIHYVERMIAEEPPALDELQRWIPLSGKDTKAFFNTSGQVYRQGLYKEKIANSSDEDMIGMLAGQGMLVKRPILVGSDRVLVGYKEQEYESLKETDPK
jgi:arsenate reductase